MSNQMQHLATTDGRRLTVAAVIDPGRTIDRSGQVPLIQTAHANVGMAILWPTDPTAPLHHLVGEVTGAAVNLRAGPSTQEAVVTLLIRGDRVEVLGATGTGWAQIRTLPTGVEGFMAARFLNPLN
jgi:SH3-like domain-containing protein